MDTEELYQIEYISDGLAVIFSTSYINPISCLSSIESDLDKMNYDGKILFDLLLANGYGFNRYMEAIVSNGKFDRKSFKLVECSILEKLLTSKADIFYRSHTYLVKNNYVLLDEEKERLINA